MRLTEQTERLKHASYALSSLFLSKDGESFLICVPILERLAIGLENAKHEDVVRIIVAELKLLLHLQYRCNKLLDSDLTLAY